MASLSYPKSVRLHYRKDFQTLLESASTHYNAVFKVFWLVRECPVECRFAVSVPKKSFKRAVKRNLLKRRTREAIRLNRQILPEGFCADFLFFYRVGEVLDYADIEKAVIEAFTTVPAKAAAKAASAAGTAEENTPDGSAKTNTPDTSAEANLIDANAGENGSTSAEKSQLDNSENTSGDE